jgi:hypothetical protein
MVIHNPPGPLGRDSDQPMAITNVLVATSGSSSRTGDIPLGVPTCSARSHRGLWALYPNGAQVAGVLDRLRGDDLGELDRAALRAIRQFLTDRDGQDGASRPATTRARTWPSPAAGYWISGPTNQPGHGDHTPSGWPGAPTRPPRPLRPPAALPSGTPRRAQPDPSQSPEPAPQRAA